jgi:hypothetical protein
MKQLGDMLTMLTQVPLSAGEADMHSMYLLVDELKRIEHPRRVVPHFFHWFEANSQFDLGCPGPFVSFIEQERDYFDLLVASIHRKPTDITVWMVNRIANGETDSGEVSRWVDLLQSAVRHPLAHQDTVESALGFVRHQASRWPHGSFTSCCTR